VRIYRDAEVYLKNDIPAKANIQQDILVKRGDGTYELFFQYVFLVVSNRPSKRKTNNGRLVSAPESHGNAKVVDRKASDYRLVVG
jgi:hypothetical protein